MHPGMHPIDDDLVRRLIAGQFPQWTGLAVEWWPSGGTVNAMYRLGGEMVVRLPLVPGGARASLSYLLCRRRSMR
jgi:aminoglycoside phosphotransferase (APT) family kinase protein